MPTEPELSREISAQLDAIEALAGVTREAVATKEQLLAAVYAQPSDMGARLVLADLLVAEGDPRGELIQLQHALETRRGAKTKIGARIKSLLQVSQGKWLDGLDAMVSEPVFRCGFASDVTLSKPIDPTPRAWRTVTTLRFASFATAESSASALADENLGGVTTVIGIPMQVLARWLRECGPRRFDHVDARAPLASLTVCDARIHHLAVRSSDWDATRDQRVHLDYRVAFHWFEHSALRELVKILELDGFEHLLHVAIADLARTPSLEALWLRPTSEKAWQDPWSVKPVLWEIRVSRDARGAPSVIDATWHSPYKRAVQAPRPPSRDGLVLALAALDEAALTSVTVRSVSPLSDKVQAELDRGLADALRKQRALTMFASAGAEHPLTR